MIGVSFNTQIQKTGTALQGEVTYRHDVPLQFDDVELLYASLTPFESGDRRSPAPAGHRRRATASRPRPPRSPAATSSGPSGRTRRSRAGSATTPGRAQFTATQVFANVLKASQLVLVFEGAIDYIPGLEDKYDGGPVGRGLRYDGPGTNRQRQSGAGGVTRSSGHAVRAGDRRSRPRTS